MYFKTLPKLIYSYKDKDKNQIFTTVPDIFRRVQLDRFFKITNLSSYSLFKGNILFLKAKVCQNLKFY